MLFANEYVCLSSPLIPCAPERCSYNELAIAFINHRDQGTTTFTKPVCDRFPRERKLQVSIYPAWANPGFNAGSHVYVRRIAKPTKNTF